MRLVYRFNTGQNENKTIPVSHKPKEERRMMFVCGDDIASLIKRFENESK